MAECVAERIVEARGGPDRWCVGVFAATGSQMPQACLQKCLKGSPDLARSHGCALIRALVDHERAVEAARPEGVPKVCDQGCEVVLTEGRSAGGPDVLVLRTPRGPGAGDAALAGALEGIKALAVDNWRLNQESDGLAGEVLRSYEQINLIFDVSAEIAILNDAEEVRRMLLTKLRHLFGADAVYYVSSDQQILKEVTREGQHSAGLLTGSPLTGADTRIPVDDPIDLPPEFEQARRKLSESRRVIVCSTDQSQEQTGHGTSMWGPLNDGGETYAIVGITRRAVPFVAGDMLVLDSALTYGGHILSNLRLVDQLKRTSFEAVRALVNAIDQKDNYTCGHSERVGFLAKITGQYMGLVPAQLQELEWAGLLHDVGKIGIPERVLNKPGKLTPEEFAIIKQHPARSFEVLRPVASLEPVLQAVLYHHENTDGTGYPEGLKGEDIPLLARIVHVVDVFDALTSTRSYRSAYDADRAIQMLHADAGTKLDTKVVEHFVGAWLMLPRTYPEQYARWFASCKRESAT